MAPRKRGHLAAVSADGHGAPSPSPGSRGVVKQQHAARVRALTKRRARPFRDNLCGGTRNRRQQPFDALLPCAKFEPPLSCFPGQFVVPLGDPKNFVDRLHRRLRDGRAGNARLKRKADGCPQPEHLLHQRWKNLGSRLPPREQICHTLRCNHVRPGKKFNQPLPISLVSKSRRSPWRRMDGIDEIECQAPAEINVARGRAGNSFRFFFLSSHGEARTPAS
jgi:hypothetical protein